ncbi:MAG: hypothetical protein GXP15_11465 [Gammaproteobacteria bacterium]|nr:hypothetical protein [Gammaproteobacteria bacterium]
MNVEDDTNVGTWSRDTQKIAVLSWISFLSASVFTMLLFAFVDPLIIVDSINISFVESSNAGYAIGFVFLWVHSWTSGWLVLRLVRRKRVGPRRIRH